MMMMMMMMMIIMMMIMMMMMMMMYPQVCTTELRDDYHYCRDYLLIGELMFGMHCKQRGCHSHR